MRYMFLILNSLYSIGFVRTANRIARLWKLSLGLYNKQGVQAYSKSWWDERFYGASVLDRNTISNSIDEYATAYHYASVELIIAKELFNLKDEIKTDNILDVGSGAGHWIDFYRRIGGKNLIGLDVSEKVISALREKYAGQEVRLLNGVVADLQKKELGELDIVNAIGVMFHIVDDVEWRSSLTIFHSSLKQGGVLIVGGHFGLLDGLNVQVDEYGVNKRLRSRGNWEKTLKAIGFENIRFIKNRAAFDIKRVLPENNILIAIKK